MYVLPYMPGGSKFMRNPPPPLELCYQDGLPEGVQRIAVKNVHGVQVPVSAQPEGPKTVLIDIYKKSAE